MPDLRSRYRWRRLNPSAGQKPLDFGGGAITGSISPEGRLIAINTYHPQHGYITLGGMPPFTEAHRYDADAVRGYRRELAAQPGYGLTPEAAIVQREAWLIEDAVPCVRLTLADGTTAECITFVPEDPPARVVQRWAFSGGRPRVRLTGAMWLQRAAYTQLTEGSPLPMPAHHTTADHTAAGQVILHNPALDVRLRLHGVTSIQPRPDGGLRFTDAVLPLAAGDPTYHDIYFAFDAPPDAAGDSEMDLQRVLETWRRRWAGWSFSEHPLDLVLRRAVAYGLLCCVPLPDGTICLLTDHMLLPLAWNRDAYYLARAFLQWGHPDAVGQVRRHLLWLFETAQRTPDGAWGRAYLANGTIKDPAYQLDQQIYPLLELADYVRHSGDHALLARLRDPARRALDALLARRDAAAGLFPTDETPGDDPIAYPYHFSSHVLLWHMLRQTAGLGLERTGEAAAAALRTAIERAFVTEYAGRRLYAYAVDGQGGVHHYHDANDVPLALMPRWGYCSPADPVWRATVDFAFSPANAGGWYSGRLGSVHTPAPWPLGDVQEMAIAAALGDEPRREAAQQHLERAARWDGALPEAYAADDYRVISRTWFAWPNAQLACLLL